MARVGRLMEIGLAWCGGSEGKVIQGSCAPMAGRCGWRFSEHSEHSEWLADARLMGLRFPGFNLGFNIGKG